MCKDGNSDVKADGHSGVSAERRKLCGNSDGGFLPKAATPHFTVGDDVRSLILKNLQIRNCQSEIEMSLVTSTPTNPAFRIPQGQRGAPKSDEGGRELFS